jgi:hypothetical protein
MRFFSLLDFQHWVLALFLGLTAAILVYLAFGSYPRRRAQGPLGTEAEAPHAAGDTGDLHEGGENPVPTLLMVIYPGFLAVAVAYLVFVGIRGVAF